MNRVSTWQAIVLLVVAGVVVVILAVVLLWLAVAVAVLGLVVWLHVVTLPRLAARLRLPLAALDALVLVALVGGGALIDGSSGALIGGAVWALGVAIPRLIGKHLRTQIRVLRWQPTREPIQGVACPACNVVSFGTDRCPACGEPLHRDQRPPQSLPPLQ